MFHTHIPWKILLMALLIGGIAAGCKKVFETEAPPASIPREEVKGILTASVDNKSYVATATSAVMTYEDIIISAVDANGLRLKLVLKGITARSYELGDSAEATLSMIGHEDYLSGTSGGAVVITGIDTVKEIMTGTFFFTAQRKSDGDLKTVTQGVFAMNYFPPADTLREGRATGPFAAKVDAMPYNAPNIDYSFSLSKLELAGHQSNYESIVLQFPHDVQPGTYSFGGQAENAFKAKYLASQLTFNADSGKVIILVHDTVHYKIKGNFYFLGINPANTQQKKQVSEGFFDLDYSKEE